MTDKNQLSQQNSTTRTLRIFQGGMLSWLSGLSYLMPTGVSVVPFSIVNFFKRTFNHNTTKQTDKSQKDTPSLFPKIDDIDKSISNSKAGLPVNCATDPNFNLVQLRNHQGNVIGWDTMADQDHMDGNDFLVPFNNGNNGGGLVMGLNNQDFMANDTFQKDMGMVQLSINSVFDPNTAAAPPPPPPPPGPPAVSQDNLSSSKFVMRRNEQRNSGYAPYQRPTPSHRNSSDRSDNFDMHYSPEMERQSPPELMYTNSPPVTEHNFPVNWNNNDHLHLDHHQQQQHQHHHQQPEQHQQDPFNTAPQQFMFYPVDEATFPISATNNAHLEEFHPQPQQQFEVSGANAAPIIPTTVQESMISPVSSASSGGRSPSYTTIYDQLAAPAQAHAHAQQHQLSSHAAAPATGFIPSPPSLQQPSPESLGGSPPSASSQVSTPSSAKEGNNQFVCTHCGASFRIKGYLTRHMKKHATDKAYNCPFYHADAETPCHPSGGFSRRDTYKTHLKARHFVYPPGTRSGQRSKVGGTCGGCGAHYDNNETWVEEHIQKKLCSGLAN